MSNQRPHGAARIVRVRIGPFLVAGATAGLILECAGLKDRPRSSAGRASGTQQRLCNPRALGNEPEVLLHEEPTSALDPITSRHIEESVYELKRELAIVIVTHNMQQAARVSEHGGVLLAG